MKIKTKFDPGQSVQLVTDDEKKRRIVVSFSVFSKTYIQYVLSCGLENSSHSECEIEEWKQQPKNHVAGFHNKE